MLGCAVILQVEKLRQLEAHRQREAALVGASEAGSEAQPESAGEPVSIGDLLDASYPALPLGGAEDVGPSGPGPRHWDQPGPERDVGRGSQRERLR